MGRPRVQSKGYESCDEYKKAYLRNKYRTNPEYLAQSKLKYYKKLYKENEDFQQIIKQEKKTNVDLLLEVVMFHQKKKLDLI